MTWHALGSGFGPSGDDGPVDPRELPLEDGKADFFFLDPPYSTHLEYSGRGECIGELDAFDPAYFEALDRAFGEVG